MCLDKKQKRLTIGNIVAKTMKDKSKDIVLKLKAMRGRFQATGNRD